jgi:hypothetical protein
LWLKEFLFFFDKKTNTMQIITKVVRAGHWYQVQIVSVYEITFSYVSGPDKGVKQKEMSETVVLT